MDGLEQSDPESRVYSQAVYQFLSPRSRTIAGVGLDQGLSKCLAAQEFRW
jgi:hypothetical protein